MMRSLDCEPADHRSFLHGEPSWGIVMSVGIEERHYPDKEPLWLRG
jgi:hypothetical protein